MTKIPKCTSEAIIFPIDKLHGKYDETNWNTKIVDNFCTDEDFYKFMDTIYHRTKNLIAIRLPFRIRLFYLLMIPICFIAWAYGQYVFDTRKSHYSEIICDIILICSYICINRYLKKMIESELASTRLTILEVIKQFQSTFESKSLQWIVPENCLWLELRLNFKKLKNSKSTQAPEDIPNLSESQNLEINTKNKTVGKDVQQKPEIMKIDGVGFKEISLTIAEERPYYISGEVVIDGSTKRTLSDVVTANSRLSNKNRNLIERQKTNRNKLRTKNMFKIIKPTVQFSL